MKKYIIMRSPVSDEIVSIFDRERELVIPLSFSNTDYKNYLIWVSEGNEPDLPEPCNPEETE